MGYPMTYARVVRRNNLDGTYVYRPRGSAVAGDMRRMESDQRDINHLRMYAIEASVTIEQAKAVLDAFFAGHFRRDTAEAFHERYGYEDIDSAAYSSHYTEDEARLKTWNAPMPAPNSPTQGAPES